MDTIGSSVARAEGTWLNEPRWRVDGEDLLVTAAEGSDLWRETSYGFVRDSGHALLVDLPVGGAVEVDVVVDYDQAFDQAGVLVRVSPEEWVKAGVEVSDGRAQLGAVVTHGRSDWSMHPVPDWAGGPVSIRVSRGPDSLTVRARRRDQPWQMVRLASWVTDRQVLAGPYCCAPSRAGLEVRFTRFEVTAADPSLH